MLARCLPFRKFYCVIQMERVLNCSSSIVCDRLQQSGFPDLLNNEQQLRKDGVVALVLTCLSKALQSGAHPALARQLLNNIRTSSFLQRHVVLYLLTMPTEISAPKLRSFKQPIKVSSDFRFIYVAMFLLTKKLFDQTLLRYSHKPVVLLVTLAIVARCIPYAELSFYCVLHQVVSQRGYFCGKRLALLLIQFWILF
jgi:hypothetical protein